MYQFSPVYMPVIHIPEQDAKGSGRFAYTCREHELIKEFSYELIQDFHPGDQNLACVE
jgi:hypothetical protein